MAGLSGATLAQLRCDDCGRQARAVVAVPHKHVTRLVLSWAWQLVCFEHDPTGEDWPRLPLVGLDLRELAAVHHGLAVDDGPPVDELPELLADELAEALADELAELAELAERGAA